MGTMNGFNEWDDVYGIEFKFLKGSYSSRSVDTIMCFDIETSNGWRQPDGSVIGFDHDKYNNDEEYRNMIDLGEPVSLMYVWQMAIEDTDDIKVFGGRTWDEFEEFMDILSKEIRRQAIYGTFSIDRPAENEFARTSRHTVTSKIFIHNAGFEFEHLRNIWEDKMHKKGKYEPVFARTSRKPMKFTVKINKTSFECRDSLVLTQKSLKTWCKDEKLPVQKLEEPKDYYLEIRTPETELTDEELQYSINDVVSMVYGIKKYRDKYGHLKHIPLTQTGAVRNKCRERVSQTNIQWATKCAEITRNYTPKDFRDLCQLFQGGWTHANKMYVNDVLYNVKCFDFASSYPAVMATRTFPVSEFEDCNVSEFDKLESQDIHNAKYHWFMKIKVTEFTSKLDNSYWSLSKVCCDDKPLIKGQIVDNGRLYYADEATMLMSDLDWETFKRAYDFKSYEVLELRKAEAGYLPPELILTILEYFKYKTSLKGDEDKESLYNESKQFINSIYGCAVTKIVTDLITFDEEGWDVTKFNDELFYAVIKSVKAEKTFLAYQQGIWVTAWARHNLWDFIIAMDERIAYCDTDSIKGLFNDKDLQFVEDYNNTIAAIEDNVAKQLGFSPDLYTAITNNGKVKRLGIMEREEDCEEFKTLGAKRYVDLIDGKIHCTIAGLPKSAGEEKIKSVAEFNDGLIWNTKESGKVIAMYNDEQKPTDWTDRCGNKYHSEDKFGICLQPTTFNLGMGDEFKRFLKTLATGKIDRDDEFFTDVPSYLL